MLFPSFFNAGPATYEIEQSLRFDNSGTYLYRTPSSASNRQTWTYSVWIKRCLGGTWPHYHGIFSAAAYAGNDWELHGIEFNGPNANINSRAVVSQNNQYSLNTNNKFRDPSAWMHVVAAFNTTSGTSSERLKIWVNGSLVTFTGSYPSQNFSGRINTTSQHRIGSSVVTGEQHCYMAEAHFVDGQALDHEDFGELDGNGVWRPIRYTGTYGTNGFYLKFDPSATNGIGHDHSGNGNHFTPTGFNTSGTGTDVMSDTPTNNWCTLNPLNPLGNTVLSEGNLKSFFDYWVYSKAVYGTFQIPNSGKYYFECTITGGASRLAPDRTHSFGVIAQGQSSISSYGIGWTSSGTLYLYSAAGTYTTGGSGFADNDIMQCAVDCNTGKVWIGLNNSWYSTASSTNGDPAAGTNHTGTMQANTAYFPYGVVGCDSGITAILTFNFGQRAFAYTPPTGFKALNTANLPEPTIKKGSKYFDTKLFTAGTTTVTGYEFQPDLVWVKNRNQAYDHRLIDAVRGVQKDLSSNLSNAEQNRSDSLLTFTSDGFTHGGFGSGSGDAFVGWNWKEGATQGFDIVSCATNGSGIITSTNHALGVAPSMIILKARTGTDSWYVYHKDSTTTATQGTLLLNTTAAVNTTNGTSGGVDKWTVSSTSFAAGNAAWYYQANTNHIAYLWSEVAGYSKFGSYTGNGSTDGPFVFCGFRPRWLLIKSSSVGGAGYNWRIFDTSRSSYNAAIQFLYTDLSDQEATDANAAFDFTSNGFKVRNTYGSMNGSGNTYIFAAFAEHPFKYANAR